MAGMMKVAGAFSAKAREPMVSTVLLKGVRLATVSKDNIHIVDLGRETMTDIDLAHKTYSVITFAEMAEAMKRMAQKSGQQPADASLNFRADVKQTGMTRNVAGLNTSETILTLTMEGTDKKSGQTGGMNMQMDMWLASDVAGYDEVREFYKRMASKIAWSPLAQIAGPLMAQNQKGFSELVNEMSKLQGIPVLQITRVGVSGSAGAGMPSEAELQKAQADVAQAQQQQQRAQQEQPQKDATTVADSASRTASSGVFGGKAARAGMIANSMGGFGGFGKKKKTEPASEAAAPAPAPAAPAATSASDHPAALMEITTELSGFSSASVDGSKFDVPGGFRQVDSEMKKALR